MQGIWMVHPSCVHAQPWYYRNLDQRMGCGRRLQGQYILSNCRADFQADCRSNCGSDFEANFHPDRRPNFHPDRGSDFEANCCPD